MRGKKNTALLESINKALEEHSRRNSPGHCWQIYFGQTAWPCFSGWCWRKRRNSYGYQRTVPPYEFYDGEKSSALMLKWLVQLPTSWIKKLVIDDMEFDAIITSVQTGKSDFSMAGMTVTEEKTCKHQFFFQLCNRHPVGHRSDNSEITSVDDLYAEGKTTS